LAWFLRILILREYSVHLIDIPPSTTETHSVGTHAQVFNSVRRLRVLVADDHPIIRRMVRSTLEQQSHLEVCDEAVDGAEAVVNPSRLGAAWRV